MQFASANSRATDADAALDAILSALPHTGPTDLAAVFLTAQHRGSAIHIADRLREELRPGVLVGCTCEGVIGPDDEIEGVHGLSVLTARLPLTNVRPFHVMPGEWPTAVGNAIAFRDKLCISDDSRTLILLGDPFSTPAEQVLEAINHFAPGLPAFGGMASGATRPWDNALLMNDELHTDGLVGFTVSGDIEVEAVVSQGCKPVGGTMLVSAAEGPMLQKLGGLNALEAVQKQIETLSDEEEALVENGLFLGVAISEYREEFGRGDFLIRNLMGVDPNTGAIAVGEALRPGQTVQLHVRDANTADEDLRQLLSRHAGQGRPSGALIFGCNGRGTRMFDTPCHDVRTLQEILPGTPAAGFFAMGEIGPVGGRNHLHGHTASIALFRETQP